MAATVLAFPGKLFNASHHIPLRPSLSAREAAFNHPRLSLNLGGRYSDRSVQADRPSEPLPTPQLSTSEPSLPLPAQVDLAVAQVDREIAHYTARLRLLRLMIQKHSSPNLPI